MESALPSRSNFIQSTIVLRNLADRFKVVYVLAARHDREAGGGGDRISSRARELIYSTRTLGDRRDVVNNVDDR